jgi:streptogramin lyase
MCSGALKRMARALRTARRLPAVPRRLRTATLLATLALAVVAAPGALAATPAAAATPTLYELPAATHAEWLGVAPDGTAWFAPHRGNDYEGPGDALGQVSPDGTVGEVAVPGITPANVPALGPGGALWLPYAEKASGGTRLGVARISPSAAVEARHVVSPVNGPIEPIAAGSGAVWVALGIEGKDVIEGIDAASGSRLARITLRPLCRVTALVAIGRSAWFGESCERQTKYGYQPHGASVVEVRPTGKLVRHRLPTGDLPEALAIGPGGKVWFGASNRGGRLGFIDRSGKPVEYHVPNALPSSIALDREGRLWFPAAFGGPNNRALESIDSHGHVGKPICADPACEQEPSSLTSGPDGSLWYALTKAFSTGGGGFTQIMQGEALLNEAGFIGHLAP